MYENDEFNLYRFMIESSSDIIFLLDEHGRFVFVNDRVETALGFGKQDLLGQSFSILVYPDEIDQAIFDFNLGSSPADNLRARSIELRLRNKLNVTDRRYFHIKVVNVPQEVSNACNDFINPAGNEWRRITFYCTARDISQLKALSDIMHVNSNYDYLTGLPNRLILKDRMGQAIARARREGRKFTVMFVDLDGFKLTNDVYGHSAGDITLQAVSARLQACLREADTLARVGGDEFVLLLPDIQEEKEIKKIANKLLNEINRPFVINGHNLPLSASIGVALYPDNGEIFDDLINGADRAMYHVKNRAKNGYAFMTDVPINNLEKDVFHFS